MQLLLIDKEALREHISNDLINELTNLEDKIYKPIKLNNKITINDENLNIENSYSIASGTISSVYEFSYNNKDYILKKVHKTIKKKSTYVLEYRSWTGTQDHGIKSPALYQLSYTGRYLFLNGKVVYKYKIIL